ncbi:MAG: hypothetical protein Q4G18_03565 [Myroides sp.]|nr:hypothetical protein [Myroides sp.]
MKKKIVLLITILSLYSCGIDCKEATDVYRIDNIEVILTERPVIRGEMKFVGKKVNSDEISTTRIVGRWYRRFINYMDTGDTIIKREGELILYIHKKDTTMIFKPECEGQVYE